MTALWPAILVTSLAGSLHCLAMCGPLVGLHGGARSLRLALIHATGRLATYAALGAAAGAVGRAVEVAGHLAAVQRIAAIAAGAIIVGWGVRAIAIARGWLRIAPPRRANPHGPGARTIAMIRGWLRIAPRPPADRHGLVQLRARRATTRAWLAGALTGLLPCGWLWAFVVSAAGTASPLRGAAAMAVFWLGTVPAMTGALALGGPLIARIRRRMPIVSACALIALGLATLAARWQDAGEPGATAPHCHRSA
jgi:sulfite exporter TauE/SafE